MTSCMSCFSTRTRSLSPKGPQRTISSICSTQEPANEFSDAVSEKPKDSDIFVSRLECFRTYSHYDQADFILESYSTCHQGVELSYIPRNGSKPIIARGRLKFNPPAHPIDFVEISNQLLDPLKRHEWDVDFQDMKIFEKIQLSQNETLIRAYACFKGKLGFQGRDFFWDIYVKITDTELIHVTVSSNEEETLSSRFVRGRTWLGGLSIRRTNDGDIEMVLINQTDVTSGDKSSSNRFIPDWIIDSVMKKSPLKLVAIKKFILDITSSC